VLGIVTLLSFHETEQEDLLGVTPKEVVVEGEADTRTLDAEGSDEATAQES
jgi:hypothetical protein